MKLKKNTTNLIENLLKAVEKLGINRTTQVLSLATNLFQDKKEMIALIILNTCNAFNITENTLLNGRKNIANRTNAIGVTSVLLKRMCNLSQIEISQILKKDPSNINKYIKKYESLDENFKNDKEIQTKINLIESETVKTYNKISQNGKKERQT